MLATLSVISLSPSALAKSSKKAASAQMTEKDSASYAVGVAYGQSVRENLQRLPGGPYNETFIMEGLTKAFNKNDTASMTIFPSQAQAFFTTYLKKVQEEAAQKAQADGIAFLESNKTKPGVMTTNSGLQYMVLTQGKSEVRPNTTDKVRVHYHGTLIDGTVFDSSIDRGQPVEFELNRVIKGWTEGLQLMTVGSKFRFFIPQELGYGARQAGSIPPYSTLIFDVELLDVGKPTTEQESSNGPKFQFPTYQKSGK